VNAYAFVLVTITLVSLLAVIAVQAIENRRLRDDARVFTNRLLNALVAEDAAEMGSLDKGTVAADFLATEAKVRDAASAREARELRAVSRRGDTDRRPAGGVVGME